MTTSARLTIGLTSMVGFTASGVATVAGVIGPITTLVLMAISLGAYLSALMQQRGTFTGLGTQNEQKKPGHQAIRVAFLANESSRPQA